MKFYATSDESFLQCLHLWELMHSETPKFLVRVQLHK